MRQDCDSVLGARASRPHLNSDTTDDKTSHRLWHSRGYLPHFDAADDWRWGSAARRSGRLDAGETPALHDMHGLDLGENQTVGY